MKITNLQLGDTSCSGFSMKLFIFLFLLIAFPVNAATIYIDGSMAGDCTTGNYSIASRTCTGSDGNAYNDIQAALTASATTDTIYFRAGAITSNASGTDGIAPKAGQTWSGYQSETATITAGGSHRFVFQWVGVNTVTIRNLTLVGGTAMSIRVQNSVAPVLENLNISGWGSEGLGAEGGPFAGFTHGINVGSFSGSTPTTNAVIRNLYVHDPHSQRGIWTGGITAGGWFNNGTIENNRVEGALIHEAIWMDVGNLQPGNIIRNNYVKGVTRSCLFNELGSVGTWYNNICDSPGEFGFRIHHREVHNNAGIKFYNNTVYNPGSTGIWINGWPGTGSISNMEIKNNIIFRSNAAGQPLLSVGETYTSETTNFFQNNLFHATLNNNGVCWNNSDAGTGTSCTGSFTMYADTTAGMNSFNSAIGPRVSGNIAGDPLFANPAGEDFRLCTAAGVPHASCTGASPAINAGTNVGLAFTGSAPDLGALETAIAGTGNITPGAPCVFGDPLAINQQSIIRDMNCPVIQGAPPITIKFPASATGLQVGADTTGLKFGVVP